MFDTLQEFTDQLKIRVDRVEAKVQELQAAPKLSDADKAALQAQLDRLDSIAPPPAGG